VTCKRVSIILCFEIKFLPGKIKKGIKIRRIDSMVEYILYT